MNADSDPYASFAAPLKKPEDCKRHRFTQVLDLKTGQFVQPPRFACWHCGTPKPDVKKRLREALELIDLYESIGMGDASAPFDIRLRPSVMRRWRAEVEELLR